MVYLPPHFTETRREVLVAHIERYDFAMLVTHGAAGLVASRVPFLLEEEGEILHLQGHLARANPQVADLTAEGEVLAVFAGPHAYVSPGWYETGPAVPTWNYADVHVYGRARLIDEADRLRALLRRLTDRHEQHRAEPWRMQDLPANYVAGMLKGIVGFDIVVSRLEGKFKLSQNRPPADPPRVIAALEVQGNPDADAVAQLMRQRRHS
ncbi:MAG TPA: FMN-binding negative transcriptional regulator [Stellaceae bacterium]